MVVGLLCQLLDFRDFGFWIVEKGRTEYVFIWIFGDEIR